MHLAELNIAEARYDLDDRRMADFVEGAARINMLSERSPGFVWRYVSGDDPEVESSFDGNPRILPNLSVWESADAFRHFVWNTLHKHFMTRKADWFVPSEQAHFVMWWVAEGHRPSLTEGKERLAQLRCDGPSAAVFGWDGLKVMGAEA